MIFTQRRHKKRRRKTDIQYNKKESSNVHRLISSTQAITYETVGIGFQRTLADSFSQHLSNPPPPPPRPLPHKLGLVCSRCIGVSSE